MMRLPEYAPKRPAPVMPTLGQLRERLARMVADGTCMRLVNETETIGDRLSCFIAEQEIAAGLRPVPTIPSI